MRQLGHDLNPDGAIRSYDFTTTYTYDNGRLKQIDGPLSTSDDITKFNYFVSSDPLKDGFLESVEHKKDSTSFLVEKAKEYSFWGNPVELLDANDVVSCLKFNASRGFLEQRRQTMAGQSDCSGGANPADLVTA